MCCWQSKGREREKILASLSSLASSGGILAKLPKGRPGSRQLSGTSTFLELSAGGQSRRNWVSSASSESSFRKRFIWEPREEVTLVVAVPARDGTTQLSLTNPQSAAAGHMQPKGGRDGRRDGTRPPQGTRHHPGDSHGDSHGDGSGDSGPVHLGCLRLAARWRQPAPGTPGDRGGHLPHGHPAAPRGLPGQPGPPRAPWPAGRTARGREEVETPRDEEQLRGDPRGQPGEGGWGRGPLVPVPPARCLVTRCQHGAMAQGAQETARAGDPAEGHDQDPDSSFPWLCPCRSGRGQQRSAEAGGGQAQPPPNRCPVGWRGWDVGRERRHWDGSTSCLQAMAGGDAFPRARPAAAPVGPSPAASRHRCPQGPKAAARRPQPLGQRDPKREALRGQGSP